MEITYTSHEGFYLPNLTLPRKEEASFGRYGRLRLKYLKGHRRVLYINLLTSSESTQHRNEVGRQAREMLELLVKQMAQVQGITEQLKAENQMARVSAMNNICSAAASSRFFPAFSTLMPSSAVSSCSSLASMAVTFLYHRHGADAGRRDYQATGCGHLRRPERFMAVGHYLRSYRHVPVLQAVL